MAYSVSYLFSHPVNIFLSSDASISGFFFFPSSVAYLFGTVESKSKRVCVCACVFPCACARLNVCKRWQSTEAVALMAYSVSYLFSHPVNFLSSDASICSGFFLFPSSVAHLFGTSGCTFKRACVRVCVCFCMCLCVPECMHTVAVDGGGCIDSVSRFLPLFSSC